MSSTRWRSPFSPGTSSNSASAPAGDVEAASQDMSETQQLWKAKSRKPGARIHLENSGKRSVRSASADGSKPEVDPKRIKVIKKPRNTEIIEAEITELEKRIADLSDDMTKPEIARDITRLVAVNDEYERTEAELAVLLDEWERAESAEPSSKEKFKRR